MFTGIVEELGRVVEASPTRLVIRAKNTLDGTKTGDSIAVNGACLTVVQKQGDAISIDVTPETLRRTNLGGLRPGDPVDLERALALSDRLGGHMVQGHIEATGTVAALTPDREAVIMRFNAPPQIMRYVVAKGFIAVDGISLTVVDCNSSSFTVSVIPYTREHTVLGNRKIGDSVNLETDIVARYVERLMKGDSE
ncbi:MAG: riboflavin synthase [Chloroflexi bacterium]|nr:riboflavin synthase [Chloroflexota bacterium]